MAWISRVYNWVTDRNNGVPITASRMDAEFDNIIAGLNTVMVNTGVVPMGADLAMGGHKITGLGTPTNSTDAATKAYVDTAVLAGIRTEVQACPSGNQAYTTGGIDKVLMQTEVVDAYAEFASSTFTAKASGFYSILARILFQQTGAAVPGIIGYLYVNGGLLAQTRVNLATTSYGAGSQVTINVPWIGSLLAADTIEVYFTSTNNGTILFNGSGDTTSFHIVRIA